VDVPVSLFNIGPEIRGELVGHVEAKWEPHLMLAVPYSSVVFSRILAVLPT